MSKFIFVTGGVVSSLGKGITAASLGCLLKNYGLRVSIQKFDPYINYNPSTMSPFQHGEIFVTEDGAETDLDLGHYERFIDDNLTEINNFTAGKIYWSIITKEREGKFQGGTVQIIPHVTNEIKRKIQEAAAQKKAEVIICEIGGTVGDIESLPFLEAIRQMKTEMGPENVLYIHVTLVPYLPATEELKTKPTQHSVKELRSIGIQPDIIVCRSEFGLSDEIKEKIALFTNIKPYEVIENRNVDSIYELPLLLQQEGLDRIVVEKLNLPSRINDGREWETMVKKIKCRQRKVSIALIGKYVALKDAYLSVAEALSHAGIFHGCEIDIRWISDLEMMEKEPEELLQGAHGILVSGGIGEPGEGLQGKIAAVNWARRKNIPFLGLSLGMHTALIELARNECSLTEANSQEMDPDTTQPVIIRIPNGTGKMANLGALPCRLLSGSRAAAIYGREIVEERHRHNYVFNNIYKSSLEQAGVVFSGASPDLSQMQIMELRHHPWFLGTQFHPEFKSRPLKPHPLFRDFIGAVCNIE